MGKRLDQIAARASLDPAHRYADRSEDLQAAILAELVTLNQRLDWFCRTFDAYVRGAYTPTRSGPEPPGT